MAIMLIVTTLLLVATNVRAQETLLQIVSAISQKTGFGYSVDSPDFIFEKQTPYYAAFAGDQSSLGGHRVRLLRDGASVDVIFVSATSDLPTPTASMQIPSDQIEILDQARSILESSLESTASAVATESAQLDRETIQQAEYILDAYATGQIISDVAEIRLSSPSAQVSTQQQYDADVLLLVKLKALHIHILSFDLDLKLADLSREVSTVVSRATLIENGRDRIVSFSDSAVGVDMTYRLSEAGMHQDIVLKDRSDAHSAFVFRLIPKELTYKDVGGGVWYFYTSDGKPLMRLSKPYATDAEGAVQNAVDIQLQHSIREGHSMTITVPNTWLTDPSRVYPITVSIALEIVPELRGVQTPLEPTPTSEASPSASPTASPFATPTLFVSPNIDATQSATISAELDQNP